MKIAVIITCFNRKQKTMSCLKTLFEARDNYNPRPELYVYLTDDGCTDGTADAIRTSFHDESIAILQGDGNLFWAGGMRMAWKEALKKHNEWDAYLLLNDDTDALPNLFDEIFKSETFCCKEFGRDGIISGITCAKTDCTKMTYGGNVWVNKFLAKSRRLKPNHSPQMCDMANANILLVPRSVVDRIGIFDDDYIHGSADYDYTVRAREYDIPVLITGSFCGACDDDHESKSDCQKMILSMSLKERERYFSFPPRSGNDYITFIRKRVPARYPMVWAGRKMEMYCPKLYYWLNNLRFL